MYVLSAKKFIQSIIDITLVFTELIFCFLRQMVRKWYNGYKRSMDFKTTYLLMTKVSIFSTRILGYDFTSWRRNGQKVWVLNHAFSIEIECYIHKEFENKVTAQAASISKQEQVWSDVNGNTADLELCSMATRWVFFQHCPHLFSFPRTTWCLQGDLRTKFRQTIFGFRKFSNYLTYLPLFEENYIFTLSINILESTAISSIWFSNTQKSKFLLLQDFKGDRVLSSWGTCSISFLSIKILLKIRWTLIMKTKCESCIKIQNLKANDNEIANNS